MPAFLGHWRILELAVEKAKSEQAISAAMSGPAPKYRGLSQWTYLGAMGPDIPYFAPSPFQWLADGFHNKKTNSFVANFIEHLAKVPPSEDPNRRNIPAVGYAFILGFLCHMAGDLTLHPYVDTFAGLTDAKSISVAAELMGQKANTHRFVELNFDTYLAAKYFGAPHLSDGPGNKFFSSWKDFIVDTVSMDADKVVPMSWLMQSMVTVGNLTYPYGEKKGKLSPLDARAGVKKMVTMALDLGYDAALLYVPDKATWEFVQHKWRDRNFEDYLDVAAKVTVLFWQAAAKYHAACQNSPASPPKEARKEFLKVVKNFSLDTGYTIRVYWEAGDIHIRYDHSWALYAREAGSGALDMDVEDMKGKGTLKHSPQGVL